MTLKNVFPVAVTLVIVIALHYGMQRYVSYLTAMDQAESEQRIIAPPSPSPFTPFTTVTPNYVPSAPGQDKG